MSDALVMTLQHSTLSLLISQAVWALCWWVQVSRWQPRPQPAPHHLAEPVTPSQAVVCLIVWTRRQQKQFINVISDVSTIPQSTSSGSEDQSSTVNIVALGFSFYLICPVHFWHATRLTEFVTIFCKSEIMKRQWWSRPTFWDKPNWCSSRCLSAECSVLWQPPNAERHPNKFLVILN